jgi:hypothetical protein
LARRPIGAPPPAGPDGLTSLELTASQALVQNVAHAAVLSARATPCTMRMHERPPRSSDERGGDVVHRGGGDIAPSRQ